jgi:hypothetical protein
MLQIPNRTLRWLSISVDCLLNFCDDGRITVNGNSRKLEQDLASVLYSSFYIKGVIDVIHVLMPHGFASGDV